MYILIHKTNINNLNYDITAVKIKKKLNFHPYIDVSHRI